MENKSEVPQAIWDRLEKLMNLRDNEAASQAEIENASARIQEILLKYNLEIWELEKKKGKDGSTSSIDHFDIDLNEHQGKNEGDWVVSLVNVISIHNMCRAVKLVTSRKNYDQGLVKIIGTRVNMEIVQFLVIQLMPRIRKACSLSYKNCGQSMGIKINTFKRGFFHGCIKGIDAKLTVQKQEMEQSMNNLRSLMVVNGQALQKKMEEIFKGGLKTGKPFESQKGKSAEVLGYHEGRKMEINKGLNGNKETENLLNK